MIQRHKNQKPTAKKPNTPEPAELTFVEHIHELRKRLTYIALVLVVASALGFQFKDFLIGAVMAPLNGQQLIYLTPGGGFSFIFTVSLYFGILITIPFVIYHLFRFLQPIIGKTSRKFIAAFLVVSTLLAAAGAAFGYFVTVPAALTFLSSFAGDAVAPSLTADSYLGFVVTYVIGLALVFQLPLVLFIIDHVAPLPPGSLMSTQRYVIIGATVLAAVITPTPDAVNMALVGMPIVMVYQAGALAVFTRRQGRRYNKSKAMVGQKPEKLEEPLAEIIEELNRQPETEAILDLQPVPQIVSAPMPVPVPVPVSRPMNRLVDGFAMRPRQTPNRIVNTERTVSRLAAAPRPRAATQRRSIDGFYR